MDISPGDSTPTSEASYSHSSTPTTGQFNNSGNNNGNNDLGTMSGGPVLLANVLPRLTSHPSTPTPNSQLHYTPLNAGISSTTCTLTGSMAVPGGNSNQMSHGKSNKNELQTHSSLSSISPSSTIGLGSGNSISNCPTVQITSSSSGEIQMNSSIGTYTPVTLANLPKILSQITGNKTLDQSELQPEKALETINNALLLNSRQQQQHQQQHINSDSSSNSHSLK